MSAALVLGCGLGVAAGLIGLAWSWWGRDDAPADGRDAAPDGDTGAVGAVRNTSGRAWTYRRADLPLAVAAVIGGAVAVLATGWPVALPLTAAAVIGLPRLFGQTSGATAIARVEAVATWTEMLQGTLTASAGLGQAVIATAPLAPLAIRPATTRLAARMGAGMQPREALLHFADEVADPSADRVVCALLMAVGARAQRLGDLLTALADSTREEVAQRLRIETSRASVRSSVRIVLVFSVAFAFGLAVLAHRYLSPFGTTQGQVVLAVVGILYGTGLTLMVALARPPSPVRLLGAQVVER